VDAQVPDAVLDQDLVRDFFDNDANDSVGRKSRTSESTGVTSTDMLAAGA
jgi:hypothetical protein